MYSILLVTYMVWGICNILQDYWGSRGWCWLLFVVISVLAVFPVFAVGAPEAPTNLQVSPGYSSAVLTLDGDSGRSGNYLISVQFG